MTSLSCWCPVCSIPRFSRSSTAWWWQGTTGMQRPSTTSGGGSTCLAVDRTWSCTHTDVTPASPRRDQTQHLQAPLQQDMVVGAPPEPEIVGGKEMDYSQRLRDRLQVVNDYTRQAQGNTGVRQRRAYDTLCQGQVIKPRNKV